MFLGDLVAASGVALLLMDAVRAAGSSVPTGVLVADLLMVAAGLLGHLVAQGAARDMPLLAIGFMAVASLAADALSGRWWIAAAGGVTAAALAPHFVVPRRAVVWVVSGVLLTVPAMLAHPLAGGAAAVFVLGSALASMRLASRLRGSMAQAVLELEQTLDSERFRSSEMAARLSRLEEQDRKVARRSLLRGALSRRMGAIEAIAQVIARDLNAALGGETPVPLAEAARRSVERAAQLARLAAGGRAREQQTTLSQIWPRVRTLLGGRVGETHMLRANIQPDLPPVSGSGESWVQVLLALAENAIEATPGGGIIDLGASRSAREGHALVWVEDQGPGIPPEVLPHVMEPFYTSRAEQGAEGLGLAMVASVIEGLEGEVRLASKVGSGTRVEIEVPVAAGAAPEPTPVLQLTGTVLVADDDNDARRGIARLLESLGLATLEADSGTTARVLFQTNQARLNAAVLDVVMPGTPVGEVVAGMREVRPGFPVLLVSGYDTMQMVDAVLSLGGVRFLKKPVTREEAFQALSDLFTLEA